MGIGDFGVTPVPGGYSAYTYTTPEWWAEANISRMLANDGANISGHGSITFQLNVVVKLHSTTSGDFAYWVQDVASVDTILDSLTFIDNIWNMSSLALAPSAVRGNGTVFNSGGFEWYADVPTCQGKSGGYAGNCIALHYPADLQMRVTTGLFGGVPHVAFQYNDGPAGWVTYDNATFPFAAGFSDSGFIVDGTQYAPIGIYYDSEFDYTGPGGTMIDRNSAMQLALEYWNGHNLESPPNAFNFGANTAEQIQNVLDRPLAGSTDGSLLANLSSGNGRLASLYTQANVSRLSVSSPDVAAGTLWVGGRPQPFTGGAILLTLAPGAYPLILSNSSGVVDQVNATLAPGMLLHLVMGVAPAYPLSVRESGLPVGTPWTVHVAGQEYHLTSSGVTTNLTNGSYSWSVDAVAGWSTPLYAGSLTVRGAPAVLWVNFTQVLYDLTFTALGLGSGVNWSVTVGSTLLSGTSSSHSLRLPNGTFTFQASAGVTYVADPAAGTVDVAGSAQTTVIGFSLRPGYLVGAFTPSTATLLIGGSSAPSPGGLFNVSLLPGRYEVRIILEGYSSYESNVTISPGNTTPLQTTLTPLPTGPSPPSASSGLLSETTAVLLLGVVGAAAAIAIGVAAARRRGRR